MKKNTNSKRKLFYFYIFRTLLLARMTSKIQTKISQKASTTWAWQLHCLKNPMQFMYGWVTMTCVCNGQVYNEWWCIFPNHWGRKRDSLWRNSLSFSNICLDMIELFLNECPLPWSILKEKFNRDHQNMIMHKGFCCYFLKKCFHFNFGYLLHLL